MENAKLRFQVPYNQNVTSPLTLRQLARGTRHSCRVRGECAHLFRQSVQRGRERLVPLRAIRPLRGESVGEKPEIARERQCRIILAQRVPPVERHTFAQRMKVSLRTGIVDDLARVVEIVLSEERALRTDRALHDRPDAAGRRQPGHDVARPGPRCDREANRLRLDRLTCHAFPRWAA